MNTIVKLLRAALVLAGLSPVSLPAAGNAYERDLAEALMQRVERGEAVWLTTGTDRFPGIYSQQLSEKAQGAALVLHGMGGHPDWPEVIAPLRLQLPEHGWATLSILLPVLEAGEPLSAYGETIARASSRIGAAVRYLRDKKFLNIVIIGQSFGATAGAYYLAGSGTGIQAFVGISMQDYDFLQPRLDLSSTLSHIDIPILDLYGSRDYNEVLRLAEQRRLEAKKRNRRQYQQIAIDGADHNFSGLENVMIRRLRGWLDKAAPGVRVIADDKLKVHIESDNRKATDNQ